MRRWIPVLLLLVMAACEATPAPVATATNQSVVVTLAPEEGTQSPLIPFDCTVSWPVDVAMSIYREPDGDEATEVAGSFSAVAAFRSGDWIGFPAGVLAGDEDGAALRWVRRDAPGLLLDGACDGLPVYAPDDE